MQYVALLRGINVGGKNKVAMPRLQEALESLGYRNVSTYINSGNVVFDTPKRSTQQIAHTIERGIAEEFGFPIRVVVRSARTIHTIVQAVPAHWKNDAQQKTEVLFLWDDYTNKKSLNLVTAVAGVDTLMYVDASIVWHIDRAQYNKSGMRTFIGTELYKNMTARNINTVRALAHMMRA